MKKLASEEINELFDKQAFIQFGVGKGYGPKKMLQTTVGLGGVGVSAKVFPSADISPSVGVAVGPLGIVPTVGITSRRVEDTRLKQEYEQAKHENVNSNPHIRRRQEELLDLAKQPASVIKDVLKSGQVIAKLESGACVYHHNGHDYYADNQTVAQTLEKTAGEIMPHKLPNGEIAIPNGWQKGSWMGSSIDEINKNLTEWGGKPLDKNLTPLAQMGDEMLFSDNQGSLHSYYGGKMTPLSQEQINTIYSTKNDNPDLVTKAKSIGSDKLEDLSVGRASLDEYKQLGLYDKREVKQKRRDNIVGGIKRIPRTIGDSFKGAIRPYADLNKTVAQDHKNAPMNVGMSQAFKAKESLIHDKEDKDFLSQYKTANEAINSLFQEKTAAMGTLAKGIGKGVLTGGLTGAASGIATGEEGNKGKSAIKGAATGAAVGGALGSMPGIKSVRADKKVKSNPPKMPKAPASIKTPGTVDSLKSNSQRASDTIRQAGGKDFTVKSPTNPDVIRAKQTINKAKGIRPEDNFKLASEVINELFEKQASIHPYPQQNSMSYNTKTRKVGLNPFNEYDDGENVYYGSKEDTLDGIVSPQNMEMLRRDLGKSNKALNKAALSFIQGGPNGALIGYALGKRVNHKVLGTLGGALVGSGLGIAGLAHHGRKSIKLREGAFKHLSDSENEAIESKFRAGSEEVKKSLRELKQDSPYFQYMHSKADDLVLNKGDI